MSAQHKWKITVVVENTVLRPGLLAEHGLSLWIETPQGKILFDTGQGMAMAHNAKAMGVELAGADALVLSHGHYDHTGGVPHFLGQNDRARVFLHPEATQARFSLHAGQAPREIGMPRAAREALEKAESRVLRHSEPVEVLPHVWASGAIPRHTAFEDTGGPFFLDREGRELDALSDDQALWMETPGGLVVVLGCAHAGVINTLDYVARQTGAREFLAVAGGLHLGSASEERMRQTIDGLEHRAQQIAPGHCTGAGATAMLAAALPGRVVPIHVADTLVWK